MTLQIKNNDFQECQREVIAVMQELYAKLNGGQMPVSKVDKQKLDALTLTKDIAKLQVIN